MKVLQKQKIDFFISKPAYFGYLCNMFLSNSIQLTISESELNFVQIKSVCATLASQISSIFTPDEFHLLYNSWLIFIFTKKWNLKRQTNFSSRHYKMKITGPWLANISSLKKETIQEENLHLDQKNRQKMEKESVNC